MDKFIVGVILVFIVLYISLFFKSSSDEIKNSFIDLESYHVKNYILLKKSTKDSITLKKIDSILLSEKMEIFKFASSNLKSEKLDSLINILP